MSLTLLLETSSRVYSLGLHDSGRLLGYAETSRAEADFDGIAGLVEAELARAGAGFADLRAIVVDVGPGNLTSVRSGIAYANALAHALRIPVLGANSLELMALPLLLGEAPSGARPVPVLCLRKAGGTSVYAGLFGIEPAGIPTPRYGVGDLETVLKTLLTDVQQVVVVGAFRDRAQALAPAGILVHDSGVEQPDARALHSWLNHGNRLEQRDRPPAPPPAQPTAVLTPLTESSAIFHD